MDETVLHHPRRQDKGPLDLPMEKVLLLMRRLARIASEAILTCYLLPDTGRRKADGSPVTAADEASNRIIVEGLHQAFPGIPVLAEESPDPADREGAPWLFVVDPLDGTKEYLARNGEFSVNIALLKEAVPVAGVVRMPVTGQVFWAAARHGAWMRTEAAGAAACADEANEPSWRRLRVSDRTSELILAVSRSHRSPETEWLMGHPKVSRTVFAGSSLKGCLIACGEADVYVRFGRTMEWDTAAMQIVVEEAGGRVLRLDGKPLPYNKPRPDHPEGFVIVNTLENWLLPER